MSEQQRVQDKQWSLIVAKAWADEAFKSRLLSDPHEVLREHGLDVAPDVEVVLMNDSAQIAQFVLPPNPAEDLVEEDLTPTAVAYCYCGGCFRCYRCGCGCYGCGFCGFCAHS